MKNSKSNKLWKIIIDKIYAFGRAIEGETIKQWRKKILWYSDNYIPKKQKTKFKKKLLFVPVWLLHLLFHSLKIRFQAIFRLFCF